MPLARVLAYHLDRGGVPSPGYAVLRYPTVIHPCTDDIHPCSRKHLHTLANHALVTVHMTKSRAQTTCYAPYGCTADPSTATLSLNLSILPLPKHAMLRIEIRHMHSYHHRRHLRCMLATPHRFPWAAWWRGEPPPAGRGGG